jgi:hypothetical protein
MCFVVFRIPDDGQSPETQWFWVLYTILRALQILLATVYLCYFRESKEVLCWKYVEFSKRIAAFPHPIENFVSKSVNMNVCSRYLWTPYPLSDRNLESLKAVVAQPWEKFARQVFSMSIFSGKAFIDSDQSRHPVYVDTRKSIASHVGSSGHDVGRGCSLRQDADCRLWNTFSSPKQWIGLTWRIHVHVCVCATQIYRKYVPSWPPLWCGGQSSWLQMQRSEFDSRHYQIFWEVVGLEWCPLSLVSTIEKLLERKSSGSGLETQDYGRRWSSTLTTQQPSIHKSWNCLLPTSGGRLVRIVRSRTKATEFV